CLAHPQRKRSRVPTRRRFRHSAPRLSSISDAWGRLNVVTPFHHLSGDSHLHRSLGAGPITASSGRFFCLSEGELLHVAPSITFRETACWGPAKVPTLIPDHFSLAPFNAVGEGG